MQAGGSEGGPAALQVLERLLPLQKGFRLPAEGGTGLLRTVDQSGQAEEQAEDTRKQEAAEPLAAGPGKGEQRSLEHT